MMQRTPQVDSSGNFEINLFRKHYESYEGKRHLIHGSEPFSVESPIQDACISGRLRFLEENIIETDVVHASALGGSEEFEGNTVLHIATSQMLDLMPPTTYSTNYSFISLRDYTILQVAYDGCTYENCQEQSISHQSRETEPHKIPVKVANVLLMVFIMAMSYFCEASSHPPDPFQLEISSGDASRSVTIWDMVTRPSNFQVMFYYMISSMAGFFCEYGCGYISFMATSFEKGCDLYISHTDYKLYPLGGYEHATVLDQNWLLFHFKWHIHGVMCYNFRILWSCSISSHEIMQLLLLDS